MDTSGKPERDPLLAELYAEIGMKIARAREAKGWTQQDLARLIDRDHRSVGRIEAGQSYLPLRRLAEISDILGVSLAEIMPTVSRRVVLPPNLRLGRHRPVPAVARTRRTAS